MTACRLRTGANRIDMVDYREKKLEAKLHGGAKSRRWRSLSLKDGSERRIAMNLAELLSKELRKHESANT